MTKQISKSKSNKPIAKSKSSSSKSHTNSPKVLKSSTSVSKKHSKTSKSPIKTLKKKIFKKTPIKSSSQTNQLLSTKRAHKLTERAIESAQQAKLFQNLKGGITTLKPKSPIKSQKTGEKNHKKVSFNLKSHDMISKVKKSHQSEHVKKQKPLQGIIKQLSLEDRVGDLEAKIKEVFQILTEKNKK